MLSLEQVFRPDPEEPEVIQPLSWLRSMIDECKERGPAEDCDDPEAFHMMVREVEQLHDRARTALSSRYPGGRTKEEWDVIGQLSVERSAHLPND